MRPPPLANKGDALGAGPWLRLVLRVAILLAVISGRHGRSRLAAGAAGLIEEARRKAYVVNLHRAGTEARTYDMARDGLFRPECEGSRDRLA